MAIAKGSGEYYVGYVPFRLGDILQIDVVTSPTFDELKKIYCERVSSVMQELSEDIKRLHELIIFVACLKEEDIDSRRVVARQRAAEALGVKDE